jgi:putative tryptophan/tyrosine transport system substrate-binding protein
VRVTRVGVVSLVLVVLVSLAAVEAQEAKKAPRVGIVLGGPLASRQSQLDAFRQGMRDLGYIEGRNIIFEIRAPENEEDTRFAEFAADLVRLKVDVLVVQATGPILAAKKVTNTTPIVMAPASDPLGTGIVNSLARPGGNITGVSLLTEELSGKRLQLLSEIVPGISRVAILWNPANPAISSELRRVEAAARALKVQLLNLEVRKVEDLERVFGAADKEQARGLVILEDRFMLGLRRQITMLALRHRLPAVYAQTGYIDADGLAVYAPDSHEMIRRSASYVDRILKGAKPGDLPIEQPTRFELVVNLKTARALGITIPPAVLQRADRVIE